MAEPYCGARHTKGPLVARLWRRRAGRAGLLVVGLLVVVALMAPLLAGDRPLVCSIGGELHWPGLASLGRQLPLGSLVWAETLGDRRADYRALVARDPDNWAFGWPLIPYEPRRPVLAERLEAPSVRHLLGTDSLGRDVLARLIHAVRPALIVGLLAVGIAVAVGVLVGGLAGVAGGWADMTLSRLIEVVTCFPTLFLLLAVVAWLPRGMTTVMVVIGLTSWPGIARFVRGEILKLRDQDFVVAARALGMNRLRLLSRHLMPHALVPVLVPATFGVAGAILVEAALSFLGLGLGLEVPTWGGMLRGARDHLASASWLIWPPAFAIFVAVLGMNLLGDGLREAIDPHSVGGRAKAARPR